MRRIFFLLLSSLLFVQVYAQNVNYYNSINTTSTGSTLETALANLITTTHTTNISYSTAFQLLKDANEDANNTNNVILLYSGVSDPKINTYGGGGTGTISSGWTREHIFPKSLANPNLGTTGPGADAHNLAPCTNSINGARGNKKYESGSGSYGSVSSTGWYPGDDWRGDVARAVFYMDLRYGSQCDINDVSTLSLLLQWNAADPVSALEDQRNDEIYQVQGNRNPFIDNPVFATRIWGGPSAQDRFSGAISDPLSFSLSSNTNSVSFTATANSNGDDVVLAFTSANGSFGIPTGSYSAGNAITGGGTVLYVGPAANIPDHINLPSSTVYKYKLWSVDGSNDYSNGIEESISTTGGAVLALYKNSFESGPDDNWNFTENPTTYNTSGDIWAIQSSNGGISSGSDGSNFWAIRDLNNSNGGGNFFHILEFQTIDISNSVDVELSFDYYAEGFESSDELEYELLYDGVSQGTVLVFQGGTGGLSSNGWTSVSVSIPDNVNSLQFRLRAKQDGGNDFGGFDNVVLESAVPAPGLNVSAYSPTAAEVQLTANASGDSILLVYGTGSNLVFSGASGLYTVGQSFQGIATVAYFGPAATLSPITRLTEGGDYSFAAYSFTGQSYSSPSTQNLSLPDAEGVGSGQLYFQGFESNANDSWTINSGSGQISSNTGSADFPPNERILNGTNSWQVNNGTQTLILDGVSTSAADSLTLSLSLSSTALTSGNGADGADYVEVYLDINNAGFSATPDITLNGNNNAKWGFGSYSTGSGTNTSAGVISTSNGQNLNISPAGGGYREADAYHQVVIGLKNVSNLALKIEVRNNSGNEIWNIDDISLQNTSNALVWNGSDWKNNEEPDQNSNDRKLIIYPGEDAEIYGDAEVNSLDLRANSNLIITGSGSLSINSIDDASGELLLEADNLGSASYIGPAIELSKEYYISRSGWHAIAFPFSDVSFEDIQFSNGGFINYAASAGISSCNTCNMFYYDADQTNANNIGSNGTSAFGTWIAVHDATATISSNHGYYLFLGPPYFGNIPMVITVKGTTRSRTQTLSTQDGNGGWNLLPNPFPTALEWSSKSDLASDGFDLSYWVFDGSNFAAYNGGVGVNGADGYIPSGQAFFVHSATPLTGSSMNTRNFGLLQGMRARNNRIRHKSQIQDIVRLRSALDSTFESEIALAFQEGAQSEFSSKEDALLAGEINNRSFYFESADGKSLMIRKDPPFQGLKVFPLGIGDDLWQNGQIELSDAPLNWNYYLKDARGELTTLVEGESTSWNSMQRPIELILSSRTLTKESLNDLYWTNLNGEIYLYAINPWDKIEVFNQDGRLLLESEEFQIPFLVPLADQQGLFIMKVYGPKGTQTLKLIK